MGLSAVSWFKVWFLYILHTQHHVGTSQLLLAINGTIRSQIIKDHLDGNQWWFWMILNPILKQDWSGSFHLIFLFLSLSLYVFDPAILEILLIMDGTSIPYCTFLCREILFLNDFSLFQEEINRLLQRHDRYIGLYAANCSCYKAQVEQSTLVLFHLKITFFFLG